MFASIELVIGLVMLVGGGALTVQGASQLATRAGISPMTIGLTVVGFGTSAPELVVNLFAAAQGETALALGNIVGSNISNLGLVLAAAALILPIEMHGQVVRREVPLLLLATTIITVMSLDGVIEGRPPQVGRSDAIVLGLVFGIFIYTIVLDILRMPDEDALIADIQSNPLVAREAVGRFWLLSLLGGVALLAVGARLTVDGAVDIAALLGISTTKIGLFIVAIGTSAPELVTSIIAAMRKEPDLAVGNLLGSNIFNSLFILPITALVTPITVSSGSITDLMVSWLFAATLIPIFFLGRSRLGRTSAVLLLIGYIAYAGYRLL